MLAASPSFETIEAAADHAVERLEAGEPADLELEVRGRHGQVLLVPRANGEILLAFPILRACASLSSLRGGAGHLRQRFPMLDEVDARIVSDLLHAVSERRK